MKGNFAKCLDEVLKHEGGFVNHPKDPGGATNLGVTLKTAQEAGLDVDGDGDVDVQDVMLFKVADVEDVYYEKYWKPIWGSELHNGLDMAVFDWAVNSGVKRAVKKLQKLVGAYEDGVFGSKTMAAVDSYVIKYGIENTINEYMDMRQDFYESLSTFSVFGRGWTRRQEATRRFALSMV